MHAQTRQQLAQAVRIEETLAELVREAVRHVKDAETRQHLATMAEHHDQHVSAMTRIAGVESSTSEEMDFEMRLMKDHVERLGREGELQLLKGLADFERAQSGRIQAVLDADLDPSVEEVLDRAQIEIERDVLPLMRFTPGEGPHLQPRL